MFPAGAAASGCCRALQILQDSRARLEPAPAARVYKGGLEKYGCQYHQEEALHRRGRAGRCLPSRLANLPQQFHGHAIHCCWDHSIHQAVQCRHMRPSPCENRPPSAWHGVLKTDLMEEPSDAMTRLRGAPAVGPLQVSTKRSGSGAGYRQAGYAGHAPPCIQRRRTCDLRQRPLRSHSSATAAAPPAASGSPPRP